MSKDNRTSLRDGDRLADRYEINSLLGQGGMGAVYLATDSERGTPVAVKVCAVDDDDAVARFRREVRVMERLTHPNVMPILDAQMDHEPPFFVMPVAEGTVNDEIPAMRGDEARALGVFLEICEGVQAIHNARCVHRDIKPLNALRLDGRIVISDMGLSKIDPRDTTVLTQTAVALGTQAYMAPEQMLPGGSRDAGRRTDVFQLGKTLYELLTSEPPVIMDGSKVSPGLAWIIERATSTSPDRRYPSVGELVDAIESYRRSKDADADPLRAYDALVERARELADDGKYSLDDLKLMVHLLGVIAPESDAYLDRFDALPPGLLQVLARIHPEEGRRVLQDYVEALRDAVGWRSFPYAERVAKRMKVMLEASRDPLVRALAIRATLIAAVRLNRFAAMDAFDAMIRAVDGEAEALAVAEALRDEMGYYSRLAHRVPERELHIALRPVRSDAVEASEGET